MSGSREDNELRVAVARVEARLIELRAKHRGEFVWMNGVIRHYVLRPTKGWLGTRFEAFPVRVNGGDLMGRIERPTP
jgi:hypothetical protein